MSLALVVVGVVASVLVAGASPASAETKITARAGAAGWFWPGRRVPIVVTVEADRLIEGTVRVTTNANANAQFGGPGSSATIDVPIEVTGGSAKEVVAVLPSTSAVNGNDGSAAFSASVELRQGDNVIAQTDATATYKPWVEAVGVLPKFADLGELPDETPMPLNAGMARLVPIDAAELEAGAAALEVFPSIVALPADLRELSPVGRAALRSWMGDGGHLLVDGEAGTIEGLPEAWQPTAGWARTGAGDVRTTGGGAQAGRWADVLVVTAAGMPANNNANNNMNMNGFGGMFGSTVVVALGRDAGFQLPQLGVLVGFLIGYVLLAGPITFIALAKLRRRTLAWLVVPALAALFTGLFAVGGARLRESVDSAHATVIDVAPGGAMGYSTVLVGSINGGRTELDLPAGWRPDPTSSQFINMRTGAAVSTPVPAITIEGGLSRAKLNLAPGQFDLVRTSGPVTGYDDALVVEATAEGQDIKGTVTNNLDIPLAEVVVFINNQSVDVGTVDAHADRTFTLSSAVQGWNSNGGQNFMGNGSPEMGTWPIATADLGTGRLIMSLPVPMACDNNGCHPQIGAGQDDDTPVNMPQWSLYAGENARRLRQPTAVTVVGWTKGLAPPLTVDEDHAVTKGRTAVVAHGAVRAAKLDSVGLGMEMLRDSDLRKDDERKGEPRQPIEDLLNGPTFRFALPTAPDGRAIDPATIYLRAPVDLHRIAIHGADGWTISPETPDHGIAVQLTPADVVAGSVTVRVRASDHFNQRPGTNQGLYSGWAFTPDAPEGDLVTMTPIAPPEPTAPASGA